MLFPVYGTGPVADGAETQDLLLDLYRPTGDGVPALKPGVVVIHGGSFITGDKAGPMYVDNMVTPFVKRGYVAVSINYRMTGDKPPLPAGNKGGKFEDSVRAATGFPDERVAAVCAALEDAVKATRWMRDHAAKNGVDPGRIALLGSSAGGATCNHVAYVADDLGIEDVPEVRVVGCLWGGAGGKLGKDDRDVYMKAGDAPLVQVHGTEDKTGPYAGAVRLHETLDKLGIVNTLISNEGSGHGFSSNDIWNKTCQGVAEGQFVVNFFYDRMDLGHMDSASASKAAAAEEGRRP
ncbi:MAG: alpha/beta hydrolase [Candidatus Sumerlaeota bacterium]|nr:alpha/beta hydrolase [Candidatus Sumerlaeota bacterium]